MTWKFDVWTAVRPGLGRLVLATVTIAAVGAGCTRQRAPVPAAPAPPAITPQNPEAASGARERALRAQVRNNPRNPAAYESLANWLMRHPDHGVEVINLARRAVALDPNNAARWLLLARACKWADRHPQAIEAATRALKLEPGLAEAYALRALERGQTGDLDSSAADYQTAAALDPENLDYVVFAGWKLRAKGDIDGALALFNDLLQSHPDYARGYNERAEVLAGAGRFEEARSDIETALRIEPGNAGFWNGLGDILRGMEKLSETENAYSKAIELDPSEAHFLRDRGRVRIQKGDFDGALADLDRAVNLDPQDRLGFSVRARAKRAAGDLAGAIEDFGTAIRLERDSAYLWRQRGYTRLVAGEFRDGLADLNKSMSLADEEIPYDHFWRFVFGGRIGEPDGRDAIEVIARTSEDPWVRSLAGFFSGEIDEARLFAIADAGPGRKKAEQQCEAWCYAALLRVAHGKPGARELFEKCVALGIEDFYEHTFAIAELARMGVAPPGGRVRALVVPSTPEERKCHVFACHREPAAVARGDPVRTPGPDALNHGYLKPLHRTHGYTL